MWLPQPPFSYLTRGASLPFIFKILPHLPSHPNSVPNLSIMSRSAVEFDFFRREKDSIASVAASQPPINKISDRRHKFRDIQSVISKLNPELLRTVIASGSAKAFSNADVFAPNSVPSTPKDGQFSFPALPVCNPIYRNVVSAEQNGTGAAPLTIFYNGTVATFDVSQDQAENILKLAQDEGSKAIDSKLASSTASQHVLANFKGDLPIARKKSLLRFLEKRKERLISASPYVCRLLEDNASTSSYYSINRST